MSGKNSSTNKSYLAVNISEIQANATRQRSFFGRFKHNEEQKSATPRRMTRSNLKRLFTLAKPEKWRLLFGLLLLLVASCVTMSIPFSLGKIMDIIYTESKTIEMARSKLNQVCGILIAVFVVGAMCNFGRVYFMAIAGFRMTQTLRERLFAAIIKQEQGWFDKTPTGELINRLSADTQLIGQALSNNISDGVRYTVLVCAGIIMMFYMSPELAGVSLAIVPPVAIAAIIYGKFLRGITRRVQDALAAATQVAEERISNVRTVKTFSQESREMQSYSNSIQVVLKLSYKEARARGLFYGLVGFSANAIMVSVLYYGGVMITSNSITVGQLSAFLLYAAYIGISLGGLSGFYSDLNKSLGAATRIWAIIDRQPIIPHKGGFVPNIPPEGHIKFEHIMFSYPGRDEVNVFEDFELEIMPGKAVAVVGPSGSGKSTLAALLLRLYDPTAGVITLDGHDLKILDPSWLRKHIGVVNQEPVLFSCSIRENILYGIEDPSEIGQDELLHVAQEANVYEFLVQMPDGLETLVGERGVMLSGGQKQRVAIARALIKDPKILILDEATSALDSQSERLVQEALERVMKGRTVLTIAHRLSTIQNADNIVVLKGGVIVEQGQYQELLVMPSGVFNQLVKHQTFERT